MRKHDSAELRQTLPLVLAAVLLTVGLSMFLSDTIDPADVVRPVVVVFGGTAAALLLTFPTAQISEALRTALARGVRGGSSPREMILAMMKVCDVSRREGLLGVAEVRSNSVQVEEVCHLIGDAAEDALILVRLERRLAAERTYSRMTSDVFVFTALYAVLSGLLGSLIHFVSPGPDAAAPSSALASAPASTPVSVPVSMLWGEAMVPFVCGVSLAMILSTLIGRLRAAHLREVVVTEIAYRGASIILEDNDVQRLRGRLAALVPPGLRP